ncbi:hypothetical protein [Nocardia sp. NPDC019395]|uniref:hypothetical protein n=1 Tax=Nocardia sp. NPDC019395 TaxID=3154686 RepID=UPI0033FC94DA
MRALATLGVTALAAASFGLIGAAGPAGAQPVDCHDSYDPCVPVTSDVDCEDGDGDGPEYTGQVNVIGPDEYDLDADGNGIGCEGA